MWFWNFPVNYEIGILSSTKSIILYTTPEEQDEFIVMYSCLLHVTIISNNSRCVGSIGKFLWNGVNLPHSRNIFPPTHHFFENTSSGFLLHNIIEIKSHYGRRRVTLPMYFAEIYECVIIELKFYMVQTTTSVKNCVGPNIP